MNKGFRIAIHGGAGTIKQNAITPEKEASIRQTLEKSIQSGIEVLKAAGSSVDAVVAAVSVMEDSPEFNAGRGSVFNNKGFVEMDASVMCGKTLRAGGVTCVRNVKNPIILSREILEKSRHVLLSGQGAEDFARDCGLQFEDDAYFYTQFRYDQLLKAQKKSVVQLDHSGNVREKMGTVGAVALDLAGNLAAATSTGGMTNQLAGRIGDSPIPGHGNYANNNTCAVSCTGIGEGFMRGVSAYDVSALMEYGGLSLEAAVNRVIVEKLPLVKGEGGLIAVDREGNLALLFNTEGMYRAWQGSDRSICIKLYRD